MSEKKIVLKRKRRCERCIYFTQFNSELFKDWRRNYGRCHCPKLCYESPDLPNSTDNLIYIDAEMFDAQIRVGIDFCCIHFQPND